MGVDASAIARVVGIETAFLNLRGGQAAQLPQQVVLIGQGAILATYPLTPFVATSAAQVGDTVGFGTPLHLAALMLLPTNGDGLGTVPLTVIPMEADPASGAVSAGDITPTGTQVGTANYTVTIAGIESAPFQVLDGDAGTDLEARIATAINANVNMPMIATAGVDVVDLASKWEGLSANDMTVVVNGPSNGITFAITQPAGGLDTPDVSAALANITTVWQTLIVNCLQLGDSSVLDLYSAFGEGRRGPLVKKPLVVVTGSQESSATATAITDLRKSDRTNSVVPAYGCPNLPCQIAARAVARMATQANNNPPVDYGGAQLTGLVPGPDASQETYTQNDASVKAGASTTSVVDGVIVLLDTITMHHPDSQDPPAYRYVVDIVKVSQVIFNLDVIFVSPEWDGAPLIPDDQATTNSAARKPKDAKAAVNAMIDSLALAAVLSDPATAKKLTIAVIDSGNPKRLNVTITVQVSGNANIISIDLNFGFFFGTPAIAA